MASNKILAIKNDNFDDLVLNSKVPVLLDFWANWCSPCKAIGPVIDELADEYEGRSLIGKVNVDEEEALVQKFKIMNIPTLIIYKKGAQVEKVVGARSKADLKLLMDKYV
jgi:thioredoxin 1